MTNFDVFAPILCIVVIAILFGMLLGALLALRFGGRLVAGALIHLAARGHSERVTAELVRRQAR